MAIFLIGVDVFIGYVETVPRKVKTALIWVTVVQILAFLLVFFLDPGTLFDD